MAGLPAKKTVLIKILQGIIEVLAGRWIEFTSTVKYCTVQFFLNTVKISKNK